MDIQFDSNYVKKYIRTLFADKNLTYMFRQLKNYLKN